MDLIVIDRTIKRQGQVNRPILLKLNSKFGQIWVHFTSFGANLDDISQAI